MKKYQSLHGGERCGFAHEGRRELISLPSSGDEEWVGAVQWILSSYITSSARCRRAITLSVVRLDT